MIFLFILILIIIILYSVKSGGLPTYLCIYENNKEPIKELNKEIIKYEFIKNLNIDKAYLKKVRNFISHNLGEIDFSTKNIKYFLEKKTSKVKDELKKILNEIKKDYKKTEKKYKNIHLSLVPEGKLIFKMKLMQLNHRYKLGYSISEKEHAILQLFYYNLNILSPGDQWTLLSDNEIQGFNIEIFGSSFNSRSQYFGSISPLDEPLGRIGTYEEILDKILKGEELKWRNKVINNGKELIKFICNGPSDKYIIYNVIYLFEKILKTRPVEIIFELPKYFSEFEQFNVLNSYIKEKKILTQAYSFFENKTKDLTGREWVKIYLKN